MGNCESLLEQIVEQLKKNNEELVKIKEHVKSLDETIKGVLK